ncbi:thioester dehydrase [Shewanella sp. 5_MG-2023]|uniref:ApeP family dehydratase n=1 Tax=unclassified Shewanella TaxID=196818 RepID=UPI0026E3939F|nr:MULTISPECIES: thioester dehydrase [unclassified Shewanella]MDO6618465.1 thioester dehydrase [Shewanella sp. 6_MG-2023]MDO6640282.1 thioester dehydrase [Shewanella sp. 5_MG-2023]
MTNLIAQAALLSQDVSHFVPHRAPMILIDRLLSHQVDTLITEVSISDTSAYFNMALNGVPNYVGIEYMAQSIAALAGVEAHLKNDKIRVGFLLGTRKLVMHQGHYERGKCYQIKVTRLYQEETGLAVFDCQILAADAVIATANVNVFQPQDTTAYIQENLT